MSINIIAAMSKNRAIGLKGKLPWYIPEDLKYFKHLTEGKDNAVLMGYNTWKSLPTYPEPLLNRGSFVITKNNQQHTRTHVYKDPPNLTELKKIQKMWPNIWICGGESIYRNYIDKSYIDKIYLTEIDENIEGDTFFPIIPDNYVAEIGKKSSYKENAIMYRKYQFNIYLNTTKYLYGT